MEYWSVYIFHPNITVLAALFRIGSPLGGTVFICENMSSLWQKCTRVPCRVAWNSGWSCPAISYIGKVGTGIPKRKIVSCQHVSEWMFCILLCRHVSGHNLTVHEWRLALTMKEVAMHRGIFGSAVFRVLWQDLETREFAAKWMPHTGNKAQQWSCYETCHNRLEWFCREGDRLRWITAVSQMWLMTFEWELKSKALSIIIHIYYENASFGKINHRQSCWSFYTLFCVIPFRRVTLWRHSLTSHFCSTTFVLCLVRSIRNWLKMLSC